MAFGWDEAAKIAAPVLGLATGIGAGKRQIKQQKKLNELGIDAYRQQREIDQANQMEMWNATNVEAQVEHMKNAGMSISAMYGGSGGGGTTAGSGGGSAPIATADGETARQAMGLQIGRQTAELALMQAQTKKTEAEAEKIAGADTQNTIADTAIKQATTEIQKVAARVANATEKQQIDQITYAANEQIQRAREQFNKAQVSEETQRDAINKIKKEAIGVGIENILKEAQVGKTRSETNAIIEGVKQKWEQVKQGWKNLDIAEKQNKINEFRATIDAQYPNVWNVAGRAIDDMITEVTTLGGALGERHQTKKIK